MGLELKKSASPRAEIAGEASVRAWLSRLGRSVVVNRLPGDASSRQYYRARTRSSSFIVMKLQPFADLGEQLPFIQVQGHLNRLGVNVPQIIDIDAKQGMVLLSDLGDQTLLKRLERVSKRRDQLVWFKRAIDLVLNMQLVATRATAPIDAYGLYFD